MVTPESDAMSSSCAQASGAEDIRLMILCAGDPEGERTFSGSARSLFHALERRGVVYHKANYTAGLLDNFGRGGVFTRGLRRLDRFQWAAHYSWSALGHAVNTRRARRIVAENPEFNACLVYGTSLFPEFGVPTYCYFDATTAQVALGRQWSFARFSDRRIKAIIALQRKFFEKCTAIFPRSRWAAESVVKDFGIPPERVLAVGAGPNHYAEPLPHAAYDARTILFVGSQWERKGGPLIVEAFRRARATLPDARLIILGCTPELNEPGVEVVGRISKDSPGGLERILKYYSEASLFCIMSAFEPFGIVIVEAQNCYVPCVAPARFAFPEMIVDGVTGVLVRRDDPVELGDTFVALLSDPARLEAMGQAGHRHVREHYTWDRAAERMCERIRADLASRSGSGGKR